MEDFVSLYHLALASYGSASPVVARALRIEGDREARSLAEKIEQACRAAV